MKVKFMEFPDELKTVECIKDRDVLYVNPIFHASYSTATIVPLSAGE